MADRVRHAHTPEVHTAKEILAVQRDLSVSIPWLQETQKTSTLHAQQILELYGKPNSGKTNVHSHSHTHARSRVIITSYSDFYAFFYNCDYHHQSAHLTFLSICHRFEESAMFANEHEFMLLAKSFSIVIRFKVYQCTLHVLSYFAREQVCCVVAAHVAGELQREVSFLTTQPSATAARMTALLDTSTSPPPTSSSASGIVQSLQRVAISPILTLEHLMVKLEQEKTNAMLNSGRVVIIDSLAALMTPLFGSTALVPSLLASLGQVLRSILRVTNGCVIVTNYTVHDKMAGDLAPALGTVWGRVPHMRVEVSDFQLSVICSDQHQGVEAEDEEIFTQTR
eukprot:m.34538 g.34538  ORF g.34538 m.34538 type:complete len:339 (-) comp9775_c0_seq3:375-1391(-)